MRESRFLSLAVSALASRCHSEQRVRALLGARAKSRTGSTWSPLNTTRNPSPLLGRGSILSFIFWILLYVVIPTERSRVRALLGARSIKTRNPSFFYGNLNLPGAPPYACEKVLRVTGADSTWSPLNRTKNLSSHLREGFGFYRLLFGFSFTLSFRQSEATRNPSFFYGNLNLPGAPPYACEKVLRVPGAGSTWSPLNRTRNRSPVFLISRRVPHVCVVYKRGVFSSLAISALHPFSLFLLAVRLETEKNALKFLDLWLRLKNV